MRRYVKLFNLLSILFLSISSYSQEKTDGITTLKVIQLNEKSVTEEIKIEVAENTNNLHIVISGTIQLGQLTVEIFDPKGNKKGNFSVENESKASDMSTSGQIIKDFKSPQKGDWKIKLVPKNAVGNVHVFLTQIH